MNRDHFDREPVDFTNPDHCRKCGRKEGDHLIEGVNPLACVFEPIGITEERRGPVPTVGELAINLDPSAVYARTEQFKCPNCGRTWQRAIREEATSPFYKSPIYCQSEPNELHRYGCGALLPCDLKPGDRVSLELWDRTVRTQYRLYESTVVNVESVRNCQSGFMITVESDFGVKARLDRAWLQKSCI